MIRASQGGLVLLSGGLDSTVAAVWAKNRYSRLEAVAIDYGQRNHAELGYARGFCNRYGVKLHELRIPNVLDQVARSPLLQSEGDLTQVRVDGRIASHVPNRNALFLTLAHALAQERGLGTVITGMLDEDLTDSTRAFLVALEAALNIGAWSNVFFLSPVQALNKAGVWALAAAEDGLEDALAGSMSCFEGARTPNEWGVGCGKCKPCTERAKGYYEWKALIGKK